MSDVNDFEKMLDALKLSVTQIADRPADERAALLTKSFGEFSDAWTAETEKVISAVADEAIEQGVAGGFNALGKGEDAVTDGFTRLGAVINAAAATVEGLCDALGKSEHIDALADWVNAGHAMSEMFGKSVDRALAKAEKETDEGKKAAEAELTKHRESLTKRLEALQKMDGEGDDIDGLEAVARLLAAALAQIDAIQQGQGGMAEGEADGNEEGFERGEKAGDLKKADAPADDGEKKDKTSTAEKVDASDKAEKIEKADKAESLAKAEADAMKKKLADLEKENAELKKNATAPKGALRVVDKSDDNRLAKGEDDQKLLDEATRLSKMTPEQRATELIKIAQGNPQRII